MSPKNFQQTVGQMVYFSDQVFWTISKINDLPKNYCYRSPTFSFMGSMWRLLLWNSIEWLDMGIELLSLAADRKIVKFGIKGSSLEICKIHEITDLPDKFPIIHRSSLKLHGNDWLPDGDLFIFLGVGENFKANAICQVKEKIGNKECEKTGRENSAEAFSQTDEGSGIWSLQNDFKQIFRNGNVSDVVLKIGDQEFKSHKCILSARSDVFSSMIMQETKEINKDVFVIQKTDPDTFTNFLHYLYTGYVKNLTLESAQKLFLVAEKYQVNELKKVCIECMLQNISVDNFCDIFSLSLQHENEDIKEMCHQYFAENLLDIIVTAKWKTFLKENPISGNELFIKHLQNNK